MTNNVHTGNGVTIYLHYNFNILSKNGQIDKFVTPDIPEYQLHTMAFSQFLLYHSIFFCQA